MSLSLNVFGCIPLPLRKQNLFMNPRHPTWQGSLSNTHSLGRTEGWLGCLGISKLCSYLESGGANEAVFRRGVVFAGPQKDVCHFWWVRHSWEGFFLICSTKKHPKHDGEPNGLGTNSPVQKKTPGVIYEVVARYSLLGGSSHLLGCVRWFLLLGTRVNRGKSPSHHCLG